MPQSSYAVRIRTLEHQVDNLRLQLEFTNSEQRPRVQSTLDAVLGSLHRLRTLESDAIAPVAPFFKTPAAARRRPTSSIALVTPAPVSRPVLPPRPTGPAAPPFVGYSGIPLPGPAPREHRDGDRAYDVVWTPHRDAPSLIGDQESRGPHPLSGLR